MEKYEIADTIYTSSRYKIGDVISDEKCMKYLVDMYYPPDEINKIYLKGSIEIMFVHVIYFHWWSAS